ncbi:RGCVC family protein [Amycolatopsis nigrescens]|uniref:RGCVC family protein n=1 Tax=Amycolatopsis nigrescens TaxID=381445 RepID=UPI00038008C9|nr:RGCVC family protein [Amycolatopsis nigrescens]
MSTDLKPGTSGVDAESKVDATCPACSHPREAHDSISLRYCAATVAGAFDRGCVCAGVVKKQPDKEEK